MDDYIPSKPISPSVLKPSKLQLATDFTETFFHLASWSHHHGAANRKQQRNWIRFGFTKFTAHEQTRNTQGYVICERKGEERIKRFVSLDYSTLSHTKELG